MTFSASSQPPPWASSTDCPARGPCRLEVGGLGNLSLSKHHQGRRGVGSAGSKVRASIPLTMCNRCTTRPCSGMASEGCEADLRHPTSGNTGGPRRARTDDLRIQRAIERCSRSRLSLSCNVIRPQHLVLMKGVLRSSADYLRTETKRAARPLRYPQLGNCSNTCAWSGSTKEAREWALG